MIEQHYLNMIPASTPHPTMGSKLATALLQSLTSKGISISHVNETESMKDGVETLNIDIVVAADAGIPHITINLMPASIAASQEEVASNMLLSGLFQTPPSPNTAMHDHEVIDPPASRDELVMAVDDGAL